MNTKPKPKKTVKFNVARAERLLRMYSGLTLKLKARTENLYTVHVEGNSDVQITVERSKLRNEPSIAKTSYKLRKLFTALVGPPKQTKRKYSHDYCVCFTVESDVEDCGMLTFSEVRDAALHRITNMEAVEFHDALEHLTTIENK